MSFAAPLFVTGSESFIGRALFARCAERGIGVAGMDSTQPASPASVRADLRDPDLAGRIPEGATVVHLAAISRDPDCRADPALAFDVNVTGTLKLLRAAQQRAVRRVVFASSEWVYGEVRNDGVQAEDQPIDATAVRSEYALTKLVGEQCLRLVRGGLPVTVLRFGIVYGSRIGNWSAVESLFDSVRTRDEVKVGCVATARRFIHVSDIVDGILAACESTPSFRIYNLSGDRMVTLGEVIETSGRILGRSPRVIETSPDAPSVRNPDNARARSELGWRPAIELEEGLRDFAKFLASGASE